MAVVARQIGDKACLKLGRFIDGGIDLTWTSEADEEEGYQPLSVCTAHLFITKKRTYRDSALDTLTEISIL